MATPCSSVILSLFWVCSVLTGVGITVSSIRLYDHVQSSRQRTATREAEAALLLQREQEEAILIQRKQEEEDRNWLMDERIACIECFPWRNLLFQEPRLCREHAQLAQKKATSQQQSIVVFSSCVEV